MRHNRPILTFMLLVACVFAPVSHAGPDDPENPGPQESAEAPASGSQPSWTLPKGIENSIEEGGSVKLQVEIPVDDPNTPGLDGQVSGNISHTFPQGDPRHGLDFANVELEGITLEQAKNLPALFISMSKGKGGKTVVSERSGALVLKDLKDAMSEEVGIGSVDFSKANVTIGILRVVGIGGMVFFVGFVTQGISLTRSIFQCILPCILSLNLQVSRPGFIKFFRESGFKGLANMFTRLKDVDGYTEKTALSKFPISWVRWLLGNTVPLPFVDRRPNQDPRVPENPSRIGNFSRTVQSYGKMISFIMLYLATAHLGEKLYMEYIAKAPVGEWYTLQDVFSFARNALWATPGELAAALVAGNILGRKDAKALEDYRIHGDEKAAGGQLRRAAISAGLFVMVCSIINTIAQIRMSVSELTVFRIPELLSTLLGQRVTDGHIAAIGFGLFLYGVNFCLQRSWFQNLWYSVRNPVASVKWVGGSLLRKLRIWHKKHPPPSGIGGGQCSNSFAGPQEGSS